MARPAELLRAPEASPEGRIRGSQGKEPQASGFPNPERSSHLAQASFTLMACSQFWPCPESAIMIVA